MFLGKNRIILYGQGFPVSLGMDARDGYSKADHGVHENKKLVQIMFHAGCFNVIDERHGPLWIPGRRFSDNFSLIKRARQEPGKPISFSMMRRNNV